MDLLLGHARGVFMCRCRRNFLDGFSLPELLVTLALAAILLGIGVPTFSGLANDMRLTSFANALHAEITLARSEAVRRGRRVTLCTSHDGQTCEAGVGWNARWLMFVDGNGNAQLDEGEEVIRSLAPFTKGLVAFGNGSMAQYVSYVPIGTTRAVTGALQMGSIRVCGNEHQRRIVINAVGRVRIERAAACDE